jgi:hypothetical protein
MKKPIFLVVALTFLLLIGLVLLHQSNVSAIPLEEQQGSPSVYFLPAGTLTGSNYQLVIDSRQVSSISSGAGYSVLGPSSPSLNGSGCCCLYLPCVPNGK